MVKPLRSLVDVENELEELKLAYNSLKVLYEQESLVLKSEVEQRGFISEELTLLLAAIDQSPVTIIITDLEGIITFVNPKFFEVTGYCSEEVIGHNISLLKNALLPVSDYNNVFQTIREGRSWSGVLHTRKKNGDLFWESVMISPVKNSKGEITHFLSVKEDISAKREAELKLQTTNANLLALLENTSETIWSINTNYEIVQLNTVFVQSFQMFYGVLLSPGMNLLEALPQELRATWKAHYDRALRDERFVFEEVFTLESTTLYVEVAMSPIRIDDLVVGVSVFSRNVTAYRQSQVDLARTNRFLDTLIDEMPNMVFVKDAKDLRFIRINKAGEQLLGLTKDVFIGKTDHEIFSKERADIFVADDRRTLDGGILVDIPIEPVETSYGVKYLHTKKVPIVNDQGLSEFLLGIADDITDQLKYDESIKSSEERYHLLSDVTIEGVAIVKDGLILDCNNALLRLLSVNDVSVLLNCSIVDFISPNDVAFWEEMISLNLNNKFEVALKQEGGSVISCEMESRLYTEGGSEYRVVAFRDITDRKNAENILALTNEALVSANADKDRFIAILGHDLRSPFNALLGFSRLLVDNVREYDISTIESFATHLNNTAENTYNLLEDILLWATLKTGNAPFDPQNISFNDLLHFVFESLNAQAVAKGVEFKFNFDENIVVCADGNMVKTVLRNLLSNAIKFSYKGSVVIVDAKNVDYGVEISVIDRGVGMSQELMESLFEPSKKQSLAGTLGEKGTGLGLVLCKEFVEKHCGRIWVESELAKGSKFSFTLPSHY